MSKENNLTQQSKRGRLIKLGAFLILIFILVFFYRNSFSFKKLQSYFYDTTIKYSFELNQEFHYDLNFQTRQKYQQFQSSIKLKGQYVLKAIDQEDDHFDLLLSFTEISEFELNLLNQSVYNLENAQKEIVNTPVIISMRENGHILKILFPKEATDSLRFFIRCFLSETQIVWPQKWDAEKNITPTSFESLEFTMNGLVQTWYQLKTKNKESSLWNKTRLHYPEISQVLTIQSVQELVWNKKVEELKINEINRNQQGEEIFNEQIVLKRIEGKKYLGPKISKNDLEQFKVEHLNSPFESERARLQQLNQRVGTLTLTEMKQSLTAMALLPKTARHNQFFWQATGLILLHPEYISDLVELFHQNTMSAESKAFLLDILAGASSPESQKALIKLLDENQTKNLPNYSLLLQRLSFISTPEKATVEWSYKEFQDAYKKSQFLEKDLANVYSLGEMISKRYFQEENEKLAQGIRQNLIDGLDRSPNDKVTAAYLGALGNEASDDSIETILKYDDSSNTEIRSAAIRALRKRDTPKTRDSVFKSLEDKEIEVQEAAIIALDSYQKDENFISQLLTAIKSNKVNSRVHGRIVAYLEKRPADDQDAKEILKYIAKNEEADIDLKNHVLDMLKE